MKAFDTNILVRILMNDDPIQTAIIYQICLKAMLEKQQYFVLLLVIMELEWVLAKVYKHPRADVIQMIERLLSYEYLQIERPDIVQNCLNIAKIKAFDLSDLLIGAVAQANRCDTTLTFDKNASKSPYFQKLT